MISHRRIFVQIIFLVTLNILIYFNLFDSKLWNFVYSYSSQWLIKFQKSNIAIGYVSRNHTTVLHFILPDCSFRTSDMISKFIIDGCVLAWSSPGLCSCSWWYICRKCVYKVSDYADTLCAWSSTMPTLSSLPGHRFFVK